MKGTTDGIGENTKVFTGIFWFVLRGHLFPFLRQVLGTTYLLKRKLI